MKVKFTLSTRYWKLRLFRVASGVTAGGAIATGYLSLALFWLVVAIVTELLEFKAVDDDEID